MRRDAKWEQKIEPAVAALGFELVGVEATGSALAPQLCVYIDHPDGINVDHCSEVSRQIRGLLQLEDIEPTHLEVSSPGLDRPLFTLAHFQRYQGRQVKLKLWTALDDRKHFAGELKSVSDDTVCIEVDAQEVAIPFADIERARLVPDI